MTSHSLTEPASAAADGALARVLRPVVATDVAIAPLVARLGLAVVFFPHGAQKVLGWFGGYGWSGTMGFFTGQMGLPWIVAATVILLESVGPLLLVGGLLVRPVAIGLAAVMAGAVVMAHAQHGFFMNWSGAQQGEGFEYHLLAIALAAVVAIAGAGRWSLDRVLARRLDA